MDITLAADASCVFTVDTQLQPATAALFKNLNDASAGDTVIDAELFNKGISASKGIKSARLKNIGPASIAGTIEVSKLDVFISGARQAPVVFENVPSGGKFALTLTIETGEAFLSSISPDLADYVSALLAPIATGERLSRQEYLDLIAGVYGKKIAAEIAGSTIKLLMRFPAPVKRARGLSYKSNTAVLELPLTAVLVLENELVWEVEW
ncbi:MAG: hypothetical protein LBG74_02660 [Spirochaetaceae bacterium]|jgi:hypothetical protein|nr:hypothetical protein [Spirochaetaceae bacterium]